MRILILTLCCLALASTLGLAAEPPANPGPAAPAAAKPADPPAPIGVAAAQAAFESYCSRCHPVDRAKAARKDRQGWKATVTRMAGYLKDRQGRDLPPGDQALIAEYLAGKDLVMSLCGKCHPLKQALSAKNDLAGWTSTVRRMSGNHEGRYGTLFSAPDQAAMAGWLTLNPGK